MRLSERMWVTGLLGLVATLLVVTLIQREPSLDWERAHYLTLPVSVTIRGAVEHPGVYELPADSTLRDLLALAKPLPEARLKGLSKRKKLVQHQIVEIRG